MLDALTQLSSQCGGFFAPATPKSLTYYYFRYGLMPLSHKRNSLQIKD